MGFNISRKKQSHKTVCLKINSKFAHFHPELVEEYEVYKLHRQ